MADPWGVDYALTADFTAVGAESVSGSTMTATGVSYAGFGGGEAKLLVQSGLSSANASRYLEFTLTPDDVEEEWAITSLFLRSRRRAGSANAGWWLLSSLDGYTEILANRANDGTEASDTVDLTTLGTLVGPITFRIYAYAITGAGNGVYLWDLQLDGTYGPDDPEPEPDPEPPGPGEYPNALSVLAFLGWPLVGVEQVQEHVDVITAFAKAYTRGRGFEEETLAEGLISVIVAASARLVANPEQHSRRIGTLRQAPSFIGWTLAERTVLNEYRGVAR